MPPASGLTEIAQVIQLSVAPVFLIMGVAGILNVLTTRIGRVFDRSRVLETSIANCDPADAALISQELAVLHWRAGAINLAITLVTLCALLVCAVIATLFFGTFFALEVAQAVGWVFIAAMLVLIGGLSAFLREIYLANQGLQLASRQRRT